MTEGEIRELVQSVAKEAAREAVKESAEVAAETAVKKTLTTLGINSEKPFEVQQDMQHLRQWREAVATVKRQGLLTAVGVITVGILGAIWYLVKGPPPGAH